MCAIHLPPLQAKTAQLRQQIILEKKLATPLEQLCAGCPCAFRDYIQYCRHLQFEEDPDLDHMKAMFRSLYHSLGYASQSLEWDWDKLPGGHGAGAGAAAGAAGTNGPPPAASSGGPPANHNGGGGHEHAAAPRSARREARRSGGVGGGGGGGYAN